MNRALWIGFIGVLLTITLSFTARANHIIGGHMQMTNVNGEPGRFLIKLTYYYDLDRGTQPITPRLLFVIFRKRDNQLMDSLSITTPITSKDNLTKVPITNTSCPTGAQNVQWGIVEYQREIRLDPSRYTDPAGYYLSNQDCCRSGGITNLNGTQVGFTYYLEFPPITGATTRNSSPQFIPINADYMCVNKPFTFSCAATDPDGDRLQYSFTTPLRGNVTTINNLYTNALIPGPFSTITFNGGYSANNPIPGNPAIQLNPQTGILTVTANREGRFIFTVRVEEFRNGQKIGETRQDYQLVAVDCPNNIPPEPVATIETYPVAADVALLCQGRTATFSAEPNPDLNYQWQRNGTNINGATQPKLTVDQAGEYTVVVSYKNNCGQTSKSRTLTARLFEQTVQLEQPTKTALCSPSDTVTLRASTLPVTYNWFRDGTALGGPTERNRIVNQPGSYSVEIRDNSTGCTATSNTVVLTQAPRPTATLTPTSGVICERDSLRLTAGGGATYQWQFNGVDVAGSTSTTLFAKQAGDYAVIVANAGGCRDTSDVLKLTVQPRIKPTMAPLAAICGTDGPVVTLSGTPTGGSFSGPGVSGTSFSPRQAGVGTHQIVYRSTSPGGCPGDTATQTIRVNAVPAIQLPSEVTAGTQSIITLEAVVSGNGPFQYRWQPLTWLSGPTQATATVTNPERDTTYRVSVTDANGCVAEATVRVLIRARLGIPDIFSPNNDQINDTWQLFGIEAYPSAQVTIFNRWGEVVFHERDGYKKPFDGLLNDQPLPAGMYIYVLKLSPDIAPLRGSVVLAR
ncbi:hypothetical protein BN8_03351 [Fibrisoma limi BUZ 3]|uniref:Ig-like domain-containing protein n=1 Tax=Fibrisoma limi BUZ 3 TaxID=1185876 RepID=I2GJX8_9BACT|nr:T9SS C-terminal target domain-containing protein [Fibrisoma limi]CCH54203.1 hypothetical protein BN8_03351 [Fibrisoma limi BUZ 3]